MDVYIYVNIHIYTYIDIYISCAGILDERLPRVKKRRLQTAGAGRIGELRQRLKIITLRRHSVSPEASGVVV